MTTDRRRQEFSDRRAVPRGGRRPYDRPGRFPNLLVADSYEGARIPCARYLDHFGFKVDSLEQTKKDLDALGASHPESSSRRVDIGRDGANHLKNLEGCKLCKHALSDPDGVLLDLTD